MHDKEPSSTSRRKFLQIGGALSLATLLESCGLGKGVPKPQDSETPPPSKSPEGERTHEINLLHGQTWQYMPGATEEGDGLRISRTGLAIRTLEDTWKDPARPEYIANPPQNIYGTHIDMSDPDGNISFNARLSDIKGKATLSFQSQPTLRYDEREYRHDGIDIEVEGSVITVKVWQEGQTTPGTIKKITLDSPVPAADVSMSQTDKGMIVSAGGHTTEISKTKVFKSGEVWLGMNGTQDWKLDSLNAHPIGNNKISPADISKIKFGKLNPNGLQAHTSKKRPDLVIGTAVDTTSLLTDPHLAKLTVEQFKGLSTEMLAKPQALQPEQGHFVWNEFDALVDFADRHDKQIHGHTLIFGEANPKWLEDKLRTASRAEALQLMKQHIQPVVSRHKGKIKTWDVVNEPYDGDNWEELRQHAWMKALGPKYMDDALRIAHEADPSALLFMNEWSLETDDDRWSAMIELVNGMKARGVPIHGIGFQAHFDEETLADDEVMDAILNGGRFEERFKELADLGLKVRVSEISVAGADEKLQAQVYAATLLACKNSSNCIGFTMWGTASNEAYFTSEPNGQGKITPAEFGDDAPWRKNKNDTYSPKPAVAAMMAA